MKNNVKTNTTTVANDKLLNVTEVCKLLNVSEGTIRKAVLENTIPYHKVFSKLYFFESEILAYVKAN